MEQLDIPELTTEQIEELCSLAEEAARKYILSKIPLKRIEKLDISSEAEGTKPVKITVDIDIVLSSLMTDFETQKLVEDAVKEAFKSTEKHLREIKCHSRK